MDVGSDNGKGSGLLHNSSLVAFTVIGRRGFFHFPARKKVSRPIDSFTFSVHDVGIRMTDGRRSRRNSRQKTKTTRDDSLLLSTDAVSAVDLFITVVAKGTPVFCFVTDPSLLQPLDSL